MPFLNNVPTPTPTRGTAFIKTALNSKNPASVIVRCGPLAAFALFMFACGNQPPGGPTDPATTQSTDAPTTQSTGAPATEGTGPERPAPPAQAAPAIDIASLPIGGGAEDSTAVNQCVGVSWLGSRIPDGMSVLVTNIRIEPSGVFTPSASGCGGPPCASFAFTASRDTCSVAVTAKGSAGASARLFLDGAVRCPVDRKASCRDFAAKAKKQSIPLTVPAGPRPGDVRPSSSTG